MSFGARSRRAYARTAVRTCPISVAARRPRPITSPMTSAVRPEPHGITSYQSPPTSDSSAPGKYRVATSSSPGCWIQAGQQAPLQGEGGPPLAALALLQAAGEPTLGVEQPGVLDALGGPGRDLFEHGEVVAGLELATVRPTVAEQRAARRSPGRG